MKKSMFAYDSGKGHAASLFRSHLGMMFASVLQSFVGLFEYAFIREGDLFHKTSLKMKSPLGIGV
jgi:hypothetical protein